MSSLLPVLFLAPLLAAEGMKAGPTSMGQQGYQTQTMQGDNIQGHSTMPKDKPVDAGVVDAGPQLTQELILDVLHTHRPEMQHCYEVELAKHQGLAGKVVASFTIQADGSVTAAAIKESTVNSPAVEKCILDHVVLLHFAPHPASPIGLAFGWTFATQAAPK